MSQVVPRLTVLSADLISQVYAWSLEILANIGVRVDSPRAGDLLARGAGGSGEDGRVRIPAELVEWVLRVAPPDHDALVERGEAWSRRFGGTG